MLVRSWFAALAAMSLVAFEAIPRLVELQPELHVSDGVGGHHQFIAVQAGEKNRRNVGVPVGAECGKLKVGCRM